MSTDESMVDSMEDLPNTSAPSLDPAEAARLISPFLDKEWAQTDVTAIHVKRVVNGFMNTLHLVSRDSIANVEPAAVIVRHFGRDGTWEVPASGSIPLSAAQQAVVYWEMGRRDWGPKVFGVFPGGRVEEFVDSHTLEAAESTEPSIQRDVARSYARLHSLEFPIRKKNFASVLSGLLQKMQDKRDEVVRTLLAVQDPVAQEYASIFQDTDWTVEMDWVSGLFEEYHCKTTVIHGDTNYLNVLVKNFESECRVMLVDFETVTYSYRGFDIGGHFVERMYTYNRPDTQLTGFTSPDTEEQRSFCGAYLQEMRVLGQQLSEHDTVEHLVLEAEIGQLYQLLYTNLMCMVYDDAEVEPLFLSGLLHMMRTYKELKRSFMTAHSG